MFRNDEIYEDIIRDHLLSFEDHLKPLNKISHQAAGENSECGDEISVYIHRHSEVIENISFHGKCCPTVKASASLMVEELKGKTQAEALAISQRVRLLANNQIIEDGIFDTLVRQLCKYSQDRKGAVSVKCVLLPWETMINASRVNAKTSTFTRDYSLYLD